MRAAWPTELSAPVMAPDAPWRPVVTVVVPMLNELDHIGDCLDAFEIQSYPLELVDLIIVDGGSTDGSRELVDTRAERSTWIRVVDNPSRKAASAFNLGVREARGQVVCLFSSHGVPDPNYLTASVDALARTCADGVGGKYHHVGTNPTSRAIGLAMVSPVGMASPHRSASTERIVDTISHPAYLRASLIDIGPFDDTLERNSDYELNHRMRAAGMRLVFVPQIESIYRPRPTLLALARQFWWYGRWKERVVRRHPSSLKVRHLAPVGLVTAALVAPITCRWARGRRATAVLGMTYAGLISTGVMRARPRACEASPLNLAAALVIMHVTWGGGFLTSFIEDSSGRTR